MRSSFALLLGLASIHAQPSLTIYNDNFAVVRQEVPLSLSEGEQTITFDGVTSQLEPDSVVLRDPTGKLDFHILEQNYRNDPVSQSLLLHKFEGKEITFNITLGNNTKTEKTGKIIRSGYVKGGQHQQPIIEMDGNLQFGLPGHPLFPSLGDDSILRPTLSWQINGVSSSGTAQLSYLSNGFSWKSDYNLIISEDDSLSTLNGWVTLNNNSGTVFSDAKVQLLAGDVNRYIDHSNDPFGYSEDFGNSRARTSVAIPDVAQKELDSYHLYTIGRPVSLKNRETKQVQFMTSAQVKAKKTYIYAPLINQRYYGQRNANVGQRDGFSKDVGIYWSFENKEENGLGIPMPKGKIRLYQKTEDNQLEFLGDNQIDHTPQKEEVEFYTGNAFDLVGERRIVDFVNKKNSSTIIETIEVKLRNRSKERATITAKEGFFRWHSWKITESSHEFTKNDAHNGSFTVDLAPDEEEIITYTVKYWW